jgi:hypothetical protein
MDHEYQSTFECRPQRDLVPLTPFRRRGSFPLRLRPIFIKDYLFLIHIGEQTASWNLQQLSANQLFLAFDTGALPVGCLLQAVIDNGRDGSSQPFTLARILRVPQIDSCTVADAPQNGNRRYQLTGRNLEMIEKLGWGENSGMNISGMPVHFRARG